MTTQKLILTDADGVLLDWITGFNPWMESKGYTRLYGFERYYTIENWYGISREEAMELVSTYNSSAAIGYLPAYLDSVKYVKKLHDNHGYKFVVITAFGQDEYAIRLRKRNLRKLFGDVFEEILFVDLLKSKLELLKLYEPAIWIEDKPSAAEEGNSVGHKTFLFRHGHNEHMSTTHEITRVDSWKEIYTSIVSDEEGVVLIPALQT